MNKKIASLTINELEIGMVTAKEIYFGQTVLVGKGVIITEATIDSLKQKFIFEKIEVYTNDEGAPEHVAIFKEKTVEDIAISFDEFSINVKNIFGNLFSDPTNTMKEVRVFVSKIQAELDSPGAIIKDVVLHGSRDDSIYRHSVNVAALSSILGGWLKLEESKIHLLTYSAILHDFGKTKIDGGLLNKVEKLTAEEFKLIKNHPVLGYEEIKKIHYLDSSVSYGVLMHHERLDGSGYPFGIKEEKIHQFAKIIAIADIFDAVNSDRTYKKSKGPFEVLELIQEESLGKLDYEYSKVFLDHIINYYMGEKVLLNTKEVCKIIQININDLTRPLLLGNDGFIDLKKEKHLFVEELVID